jgi:hypothetical protein
MGHVLTTILVYILAKEIVRDKDLSFWTALMFGLGVAGYQATAWPITNINVQGAAIFAIISLIFFKKCIDKNLQSQHLLFTSLVYLYISLMFKEIAVAFFIFYILLYFVYRKGRKIHLRTLLYIVMSCLIYLGFRIYIVLDPVYKKTVQLPTETQSIGEILTNLISFPFISLSQMLIFEKILWSLSQFVGKAVVFDLSGGFGTTSFDRYVYSNVLPVVNYVFAIIVIIITYLAYKKSRYTNRKQIILFGALFVFLNSFIYALSPERVGVINIIDSRNLYFLMIGFSFVFVATIKILFSKREVFIAIMIAYLSFSVFFLEKRLLELAGVGNIRRDILTRIIQTYPELPERVVFFTESDSSYYGLPPEENLLPFQSGFGQTLLVWYFEEERFPKEFYENRFLWEIEEQGYKEIGGRGFGYFREYDLLKTTLQEYNLPVNAVIAFSWSKGEERLNDVTLSVRNKLADYEKD